MPGRVLRAGQCLDVLDLAVGPDQQPDRPGEDGEQHQHRDHADHAALADADVVAAPAAAPARGERAGGVVAAPAAATGRRSRRLPHRRRAHGARARPDRAARRDGLRGLAAARRRRPRRDGPRRPGRLVARRHPRPSWRNRRGICSIALGRTPVPPGKTVYGCVVRARASSEPSGRPMRCAPRRRGTDAGRLRIRGSALSLLDAAPGTTRGRSPVSPTGMASSAPGPPAHALGREAGRYPDARHVVVGLWRRAVRRSGI